MLLYLGEGLIVPLRFVAFIFGIVLPAASLFARISSLDGLEPPLRGLIGATLAMLAITPLFYVRRFLPLPAQASEIALACLLCGAAIASGAYRQFVRDLNDPLMRMAGTVIFGVFPVLFMLTWMGWMVHQGRQVVCYGLFPVDIGTALGHVAMINAAQGLPHWQIPGSETVNYHWLYYAFPAWLSTFGGGHSSNPPCLALCNFAVACLLFAVLCATCASLARMNGIALRPLTIIYGGLVVTMASVAMYHYKAVIALLIRVTHIHSLSVAPRNGLLLPVPNSLTMFGNNTLALAMILLVLYLLMEWNRIQRMTFLVILSFFLAMIPAYSVTLMIPCVLAVAAWLLIGNVRRFPTAALTMAVIGGAVMAGLAFGLHIFGSNRRISIQFDHGLFARHVFFCMLPLWCLAWMVRRQMRQCALFWLLLAACVLVPSFVYIPGTSTGLIDFSMKTATLIAVTAMPIVCSGLEVCRSNWRRPMAVVAAVTIVIGAGTTVAYAGRYAFERVRHQEISTALALPVDYVACLRYIRDRTPIDAVVIDPETGPYPMVPTLAIGERRIYLPDFVTDNYIATDYLRSREIARRREDFQAWKASRFSDETLSREFAIGANYMILPNAQVNIPFWQPVQPFGDYTVWQSSIGPGRATGSAAQ